MTTCVTVGYSVERGGKLATRTGQNAVQRSPSLVEVTGNDDRIPVVIGLAGEKIARGEPPGQVERGRVGYPELLVRKQHPDPVKESGCSFLYFSVL